MSDSAWFTAQQPARSQRQTRYETACFAHPGKMLPEIARRAIAEYSKIGEIVCDPMCGIGTTLVEAQDLGRNCIGAELEEKWSALAQTNIARNRADNTSTFAHIFCCDARNLLEIINDDLRGRVSLVLTSPPYGSMTHGRAKAHDKEKVSRWDDRYSQSKDNLGETSSPTKLFTGLREIFANCFELLKPGGYFLQTTRPWRRNGVLTDFPGEVIELMQSVGYEFLDRKVALLAGIRDGEFVSRAAFFQILGQKRSRERGVPHLIPAHEDLLIFRKPT
jgi:modification methylase